MNKISSNSFKFSFSKFSSKYSTKILQANCEPFLDKVAEPAPSETAKTLHPLVAKFLKAKSSSLKEPTFAWLRPRLEAATIFLSKKELEIATLSSFAKEAS
ncbi:hypothetical protein D3C72_1869530 [compost metagenome]